MRSRRDFLPALQAAEATCRRYCGIHLVLTDRWEPPWHLPDLLPADPPQGKSGKAVAGHSRPGSNLQGAGTTPIGNRRSPREVWIGERRSNMRTHNATNERIKRAYFAYLREAKRNSEQTI